MGANFCHKSKIISMIFDLISKTTPTLFLKTICTSTSPSIPSQHTSLHSIQTPFPSPPSDQQNLPYHQSWPTPLNTKPHNQQTPKKCVQVKTLSHNPQPTISCTESICLSCATSLPSPSSVKQWKYSAHMDNHQKNKGAWITHQPEFCWTCNRQQELEERRLDNYNELSEQNLPNQLDM